MLCAEQATSTKITRKLYRAPGWGELILPVIYHPTRIIRHDEVASYVEEVEKLRTLGVRGLEVELEKAFGYDLKKGVLREIKAINRVALKEGWTWGERQTALLAISPGLKAVLLGGYSYSSQVLTANGTWNWDGANDVLVHLIGGGGGGGKGAAGLDGGAGAGAGSSVQFVVGVNADVSVTVGGTAAGGTSGDNAVNGKQSTFPGLGATLTANGGAKGTWGSPGGAGGAAGGAAGPGGYKGGNGGSPGGGGAGGGGGAAGYTGAGGNGSNGGGGDVGGGNGDNPGGDGGTGRGNSSSSAGGNGSNYGGGGGGGARTGDNNGGQGAAGYAFLEWWS